MRSWLVNIRKGKEMTQNEVSQLSGVSRSAYSNIEIGVRSPSVETAKRIANVLEFEWTLFFTSECPVLKQKDPKKAI
ncbi:helix-turn-helix transcriptional regulator [Bacillus badius]|uniref:helix-turn-helix transcriptional regulator n=1 Tax=Bacillus badius TaxID=1455 RepID=UPI000596F70D|nr:helix-turn-helix transcriptional regulator [Bacillus badius]MED4715254.1 helix-turn-helix transcriptional regulator [Bacillus badius]